MHAHTSKRTGAAILALAVIAPATALAANPKSEGAYFSAPVRSQSAQVSVHGGKIINGSGTMKFKKNGKACGSNISGSNKLTTVSFNPKRGVKPKNGSFSLSGKNAADPKFPAKVKVSGYFISSKKAKLTVSASYKGCKARFTTSKAKYTQGG